MASNYMYYPVKYYELYDTRLPQRYELYDTRLPRYYRVSADEVILLEKNLRILSEENRYMRNKLRKISTRDISPSKHNTKVLHDTKASDEVNECQICMENERRAAFDCGHCYLCISCAKKQTECALCREPIKSIKQIFLS